MSILKRNLLQFDGPWAIPVEVRANIFIIPALLIWLTWGHVGIFGMLFVIAVLFASILLHELGHAWGCVVHGIPVHRIEIHTMGGTCFFDPRDVTIPQAELLIGMGPIVNLTLWAVASLASGLPLSETVLWGLDKIALVNLILGVLNLIPTMPFDGGRLLHVVLQRVVSIPVATQISGAVGLVLALSFVPAFLLVLVMFKFLLLLWIPWRLNWRMLLHGDFGPRYSKVKRYFWQWRRRPEGPWDRLPPTTPAE